MTRETGHGAAARARLLRHRRRVAWRGVVAALVLPAWVVGFSLFGVGALGADIGLPFSMVVLSTPLVWAGPAQFVMFGSLAAGAGLMSVALAVSLTSMRLLPMGLSLLAMMRQHHHGLAMRVTLSHFVVVTSWVEAMRVLPGMARRDRATWFLGFGLTCMTVCTALTALGYALSATMPRYLAAGFMAITPLFFLLSLVGGARRRPEAVAVGLGLVLGAALGPVLEPVIGRDLDLMVAGSIAGLAAFAVHRRSP